MRLALIGRRGRRDLNPLSFISAWAAVALIILLLAQRSAFAGPALAATGANFAAGWLVNCILVAAFAETLLSRLPLIFALPAVMFYSVYYLEYFEQRVQIEKRAAELARTNPSEPIGRSFSSYSLVTPDADLLVASHRIDVAYRLEPSLRPHQYYAYRLAPASQVGELPKLYDREIQVLSIYWDERRLDRVREVRWGERPTRPILTVSSFDNPGRGWTDFNIGEKVTTFDLAGSRLATFRSGYVFRLPAFPFLSIGCRFPPLVPGRTCAAEFLAKREEIESRPRSVDKSRYDTPESIVLGLPILQAEALNAPPPLAGPPKAPTAASAPVRPSLRKAMDALLHSDAPPPAEDLGLLASAEPNALAPFAGAMAQRLIELSDPKTQWRAGARDLRAAFSVALAALPERNFAAVADKLGGAAFQPGGWRDMPALYVRLGDSGPKAYAFLRDRAFNPKADALERLLALLALCRSGIADAELVASMRRDLAGPPQGDALDAELRGALFINLKKYGDDGSLEQAAQAEAGPQRLWDEKVLENVGKTNAGPNNCMTLDWPAPDSLPANMAPSLKWRNEQWSVR